MRDERGIQEKRCVRQLRASDATVSLSGSSGGNTQPMRRMGPLSRE